MYFIGDEDLEKNIFQSARVYQLKPFKQMKF